MKELYIFDDAVFFSSGGADTGIPGIHDHVAYLTECTHFRYLRSVSTRKKLVSNGHLPLGVEHQKGV